MITKPYTLEIDRQPAGPVFLYDGDGYRIRSTRKEFNAAMKDVSKGLTSDYQYVLQLIKEKNYEAAGRSPMFGLVTALIKNRAPKLSQYQIDKTT